MITPDALAERAWHAALDEKDFVVTPEEVMWIGNSAYGDECIWDIVLEQAWERIRERTALGAFPNAISIHRPKGPVRMVIEHPFPKPFILVGEEE